MNDDQVTVYRKYPASFHVKIKDKTYIRTIIDGNMQFFHMFVL